MLVYHRVTPCIKFVSTHLDTWVERGIVKVKCLTHEHNTMSLGKGLEPGLLDPESSALTMRPPHLPHWIMLYIKLIWKFMWIVFPFVFFFVQAAFRDNTVGLPKLCPPENIGKFNSAILQDYMKRYYQPSRIVIAGVNVDHQHLVDLTNDHFVNKPPMWHREGGAMESPDRSIAQYTGGIVKVFWNTPGCFVMSF